MQERSWPTSSTSSSRRSRSGWASTSRTSASSTTSTQRVARRILPGGRRSGRDGDPAEAVLLLPIGGHGLRRFFAGGGRAGVVLPGRRSASDRVRAGVRSGRGRLSLRHVYSSRRRPSRHGLAPARAMSGAVVGAQGRGRGRVVRLRSLLLARTPAAADAEDRPIARMEQSRVEMMRGYAEALVCCRWVFILGLLRRAAYEAAVRQLRQLPRRAPGRSAASAPADVPFAVGSRRTWSSGSKGGHRASSSRNSRSCASSTGGGTSGPSATGRGARATSRKKWSRSTWSTTATRRTGRREISSWNRTFSPQYNLCTFSAEWFGRRRAMAIAIALNVKLMSMTPVQAVEAEDGI